MGFGSLWHWLILGVVILLLFGKGRFSDMMGDVAKGLKSFKKGLSEDDEPVEARRLTEEKKPDVPLERSASAEPSEKGEP